MSRRVFVPPAWLIVVTTAAVVVGAVGLGWLGYDRYWSEDSTAKPRPTVSATASATVAETPSEPEPTESVEPTPSPTPEPVVRSAGVSVLNNTRVPRLAAGFASGVRTLGWADVSVGNWRGSIGQNTIYFPPALADQAQVLAQDLQISRVVPSISGMRTDRLTVILAETASSVP